MKVYAVQFDIAWENRPENFKRVRQLLEQTRPEPNSLVALPEMFATGFSMNANEIADVYGGETEQFLSTTAKDFGVCLMAGAAMRTKSGHVRNKALIFSPDGDLLAFYAKMRTFTPGGETENYLAGTNATVFEWQGVNISPFICYDLRFPEIFRAAMSKYHPQVITLIANWPEKRIHHWTALLQARAIENQAYVVAVNRIGHDPFQSYGGLSMVINPQGEIVANAQHNETVVGAELDLKSLCEYRQKLPFLADMR